MGGPHLQLLTPHHSFWIPPEGTPARVTLGVTSLLTLTTQVEQSDSHSLSLSLSLSPEHANPADPPPGLLHQGHRRLARNLRCLRLSQVFNSGPKTIYNAKFVKIKNVKSVSNSTWQKPCSAWWSLQSSTPCLTFQRPEPGFTNVVLVGEGCKKRPV